MFLSVLSGRNRRINVQMQPRGAGGGAGNIPNERTTRAPCARQRYPMSLKRGFIVGVGALLGGGGGFWLQNKFINQHRHEIDNYIEEESSDEEELVSVEELEDEVVEVPAVLVLLEEESPVLP